MAHYAMRQDDDPREPWPPRGHVRPPREDGYGRYVVGGRALNRARDWLVVFAGPNGTVAVSTLFEDTENVIWDDERLPNDPKLPIRVRNGWPG